MSSQLMFNLQVFFKFESDKYCSLVFLGTLCISRNFYFYIKHKCQEKDWESEIIKILRNHILQCFNFTDGETETTKVILSL